MKTIIRRRSMPEWMEPYRGLIGNTGGNGVEEFIDCHDPNCNVVINAPRALLCMSVQSQVNLLRRLKIEGLLPDAMGLAVAVKVLRSLYEGCRHKAPIPQACQSCAVKTALQGLGVEA